MSVLHHNMHARHTSLHNKHPLLQTHAIPHPNTYLPSAVMEETKNRTSTQERDNQNPLIRTMFTTRTHFLIRVEAFDKRRPELNLPQRRQRPGGPQQSKPQDPMDSFCGNWWPFCRHRPQAPKRPESATRATPRSCPSSAWSPL